MKTPFAARLARIDALFALAVLIVNDHLLKGAGLVPAWLTGKLSDFAGLYFFPMLLAVAISRVTASPRRAATIAALSTAVVFTTLKLSPAVAALALHFGARIAADATDLVALPIIALSWRAMIASLAVDQARATAPAFGLRERVTLLVAALASMATSAEPKVPQYAERSHEESSEYTTVRCARFAAYVTSREPSRVEIIVRSAVNAGTTCVVQVETFALITDGVSLDRIVAPTKFTGAGDGRAAFRFVIDPPRTLAFGAGAVGLELTLAGEDGGIERVRIPVRALAEIASGAADAGVPHE